MRMVKATKGPKPANSGNMRIREASTFTYANVMYACVVFELGFMFYANGEEVANAKDLDKVPNLRMPSICE